MEACIHEGGRLVNIPDQPTQTYIESMVDHYLKTGSLMSYTWIGINATVRSPTSYDLIRSDGQKFSGKAKYVNWKSGEPNEIGNLALCMSSKKNPNLGKWADDPYDAMHPYICEFAEL